MFNPKNISRTIVLCLGVLIMSFLVGYLVFAWTEPSQAPPDCTPGQPGCDTPINAGSATQDKTGWFTFEGGGTRNSTFLATQSGNVGIGTTGPGSTLTVRRSAAGTTFAVRNTGDTANTFTISDAGAAYMTGFQLGTSATAGHVLTANASGVGTWQSVAGGIGGSGTATQVAFFTAATTIGSDSGLYWDNTTKRLGIGITPTEEVLDVHATVYGAASMGDSIVAADGLYSVAVGEGGNSAGRSSFKAGGPITVNGSYSIGFNLDNTARTVTNANTMSIMGGNVGIGTMSPEFKLSLDNDGGIIAKGTYGSGATLSTSGAGARLIWYPRKAAFRAGYVNGTQWNDANIGTYSFAWGYNTIASGNISTAIGDEVTASGVESVAIGEWVTAGANSSFVLGRGVSTTNRIINNTADSLMVGFNSTIPTLYVGPSSGVGTTGDVGIGMTNPSAKLHVLQTTAPANPAGGGVYVYNSATNGNAILAVRTTAAAGDPFLSLDIDGVYGWSVGLDDADNKFKIARSWNFDTTQTSLALDTSGNIYVNGVLNASGYKNNNPSVTDVTSSRTMNTWYTNTDGKTKIVYTTVVVGAGEDDIVYFQLSPDGGTTVRTVQRNALPDLGLNWVKDVSVTLIVPDGWSYRVFSSLGVFYTFYEQIL